MSAQRTSQIGIMFMALSLLMAACGGSSNVDEVDATTATTSEAVSTSNSDAPDDTESPESTDTTGADDSGATAPSGSGDLSLVPPGETDILGNPAGQGFVEIGGVRYDVILSQVCANVFGLVQANGDAADGSDVTVDADIPPENWETDTEMGWSPPLVQIEIASGNYNWRAEAGLTHFAAGENVELSADQSSVTSFTNDGSLVTGTANFVNTFNFDEVETASGSFEFYCP